MKKEQQIPSVKFKTFIYLWNQMQDRTIPDIHLEMAGWLEECWNEGERRMLLMAFRGAGKSTIIGLFAAWLIYKNVNIRIMVLAADQMLAGKMVRNVKRIIESHPLTMGLKPDNADQWASDRFTVKRNLELRDPTMLAKGIISNITGSRADVFICDDVEVPNTCDSPGKREDLRERLGEIPYVLVSEGLQLYVGTPHHYYSIYADAPRDEIGEKEPFLKDFERLSVPALDENNDSTWPEELSNEDIEQKRIDEGPNKFDAQMMLRPVNIMQGRLDPDLLKSYRGEAEYDRIYKKLFIGGSEMAGASCWWDPSFGKTTSDDSVCAVVYSDPGGYFFLHDVVYIKVDEHDELAEAAQQVAIVAKITNKYYLPSITIEANGLGKFLPNMLRNEMNKEKIPTRVRGLTSTRPKALRIIEGFDALMASGRLYVHEKVRETNFIMEMREWRPSKNGHSSKGKDDALDAVAGALSQHPDRYARGFPEGSFSWQRASSTHTAKGDWEL